MRAHLPRLLNLPGPLLLLPPLWRRRRGRAEGERPAAAGAARAAPASSCVQRGLLAVAAAAQQRHSFVAALSMEDATRLLACYGTSTSVFSDVRDMPGDDGHAEDWRRGAGGGGGDAGRCWRRGGRQSACLPGRICHSLYAERLPGVEWPDGGVASASFLNAKPAVGGIGVEPRRGGVLRVLFTVTSDFVADTIVRFPCNLRNTGRTSDIFDILSDEEEAQHRVLWPAFVAAKAAGKRAQFHRARLIIDGERVSPRTCKV
ncbi:hypothetical protein FOA52_015213 [Chlamydomonas sp. UWO 241]|nr:hypothetical protein FOA52_015213 [Chlamydomonas sp. UWO 241]